MPELNSLEIIGRSSPLFDADINSVNSELNSVIRNSNFLIIGGAGSIGQAVALEIFSRNPRLLHVVDISENNLVELVRNIRSSIGYQDGEFRTFALDCGGREFEALIANSNRYDYVFNLSALKHVRSEEDPFTLIRMIEVNIINSVKMSELIRKRGSKKYFSVSTDKAANPVNMMGASKRIMEMFLMRKSLHIPISMARFANVAFSDGSLLFGFHQRLIKRQPLSVPNDVKRYFLTLRESGELCLLSCLLGENRDIFFPKLEKSLVLTGFDEIAHRFLNFHGYETYPCSSEDEARSRVDELIPQRKWPVYFFSSDTTGEKSFEEFYTGTEDLDLSKFRSIGIIKNEADVENEKLDFFLRRISEIKSSEYWNKESIVSLFNTMLPDFNHKETGKYLDSKM